MALTPQLTKFTTASPVVMSLSFSELASNNSFIIFYGFSATDSSSTTYNLTTQTPRSSVIELGKGETTSTGFDTTISYDSSPLTLTMTMEGEALVTYTLAYNAAYAGDNAFTEIEIAKWDGSTETILVTGTTEGMGDTDQETNITLVLTVPKTIFAVGDIIRLNMRRVIESAGSSPGKYLRTGQDPSNRDGLNLTPSSEDVTTQLKFVAPFKTIN